MSKKDTIVAIATPPGKGGVGVVRISGTQAKEIGESICNKSLPPRVATFARFTDEQGDTIDSGIVLYFPSPKSFTGEDVVELQGHAGPVVQDLIVKQVLASGARMANPGEFSERAYLNDKIDLAQAEAIADLIESGTATAAKGAMRSLQGEFSAKVNTLLEELIYLRTYVEAAIDFPDEEIDFLADEKIRMQIQSLQESISLTITQAGQGTVLRNGFRLVIAGKPNAGKSSLLNALAGQETAIVTDVPGTTRDIVQTTIDLDGLPVHIVDTAGLRDSQDIVEKIGIERAQSAIADADHVLQLIDLSDKSKPLEIKEDSKLSIVYNKIDLVDQQTTEQVQRDSRTLFISAKNGDGISQLKSHIKAVAGFDESGESLFTARRRHLDALQRADTSVQEGLNQLKASNSGELLAEELLIAQHALNEITGEFTSDDLLGQIFSGFCIGK